MSPSEKTYCRLRNIVGGALLADVWAKADFAHPLDGAPSYWSPFVRRCVVLTWFVPVDGMAGDNADEDQVAAYTLTSSIVYKIPLSSVDVIKIQ
jgi:hypothetical protein